MSRIGGICLGLALTAGLGWTVFEDARFVYGISFGEERAGRGFRTLAEENRTLTRYSYVFFPNLPSYFTHGVVDPNLEQRVLSGDGFRILTGDLEALAVNPPSPGAEVLSEGLLEGTAAPGAPLWNLKPKFEMRPKERYVLVFHFDHPSASGVLKVTSRTMFRLYGLPIYGEPASFGSSPGASPVLPLSSDSSQAQTVALVFIPQGESEHQDFRHFGRYRWIRYDPAQLPVVVKGWIPYRAEVDSAQPGWLETPRLYQSGYSATVNGLAVEVRPSPNGLVMVAIPRGRSQALVKYHPAGLTICYWLSLAAIISGCCVTAAAWRRRIQALPTANIP